MISLKDYNLETVRDFSHDQFLAHKTLIEDISSENDFGKTGVKEILNNYLSVINRIYQEYTEKSTESFRLTKEEVLLYDMTVEIARLCYKHAYETSSQDNDWEEEFSS